MQPFWHNRPVLMRWALSALVETAVIIPWMVLLYAADTASDWPDTLPGAWLPLLVYLAAGLWESGDKRDERKGRALALLGGTAIAYLLAYAALPAPLRVGILQGNKALSFIPVAAYLWYRGASSAIEGIEYGSLFSRVFSLFGGQMGGILLLMLVGRASEKPVQLLLYCSVLLFFAAGLSLLVVTRERSLRVDHLGSGEQTGQGSITPAMTSLVAGLVGLTFLASAFLSVDRLGAILAAGGRLVSPVADWLLQVALLIVVRWAMLIMPLIQAIGLLRGQGEPPPQQQGGEDLEALFLNDQPTGAVVNLKPYAQGLLLLLFLGVLIAWLYRLNRRRRAVQEVEEERISLGFWASLLRDLGQLMSQLGRQVSAVADETLAAINGVDPRDPRGLFRRLQGWGAAQGRPRGEAETPNHYQAALAQLKPAAAEPARAVTAVYNQARYGRTPPDDEAVATARELLEGCVKDFTR